MAFEAGLLGLLPISLSNSTQAIILALSVLFALSIPISLISMLFVRRAGKASLAGRLLADLLPVMAAMSVVCILAVNLIASPKAGLPQANNLILLTVLAAVFTMLTILIGVIVNFELRSLRWLVNAAASLASNKLDVSVPMQVSQRQDELGQLARAIQSITNGLGAGRDEIARLLEVSQSISARTPLSQSLPVLLRGALRGVSAGAAGIYLVETPQGVMRHVASEGDLPILATVEGTLERLANKVWRSATFESLPDLGSDAGGREDPARPNVRALAVFPMLREGRTIGAMWVAWSAPRAPSPMDRSFLAALANLAGLMVEDYRIFCAGQLADQRLQAILGNAREGILIADGDGRLCIANRAAEEILKFSFKTREGDAIQTVLNHEQVYMMIADLLRDRGPAVVEIERGGRRLNISATRLKLGGQSVTRGWVFVLRDVTEAHRLDEEENDALGMLTHAMSTPTQSMRGYASLLKSAGPINETQDEYIRKILKGVEDLTTIVSEYRQMSDISRGQGITRAPCQLLTLASKVAVTMSVYAEGKGLTLKTDMPKDLPKIIGDPSLLEHAIRNLLDNAIKYTNAPGWIKLTVQELSPSVQVTVSDSGIGIPASEFQHIFEVGKRVKSRETLHIHGTGNGLAIVKKIVEQHGGQVWVESQLGIGSAFHIAIPKERRIMDLLGEEPPAGDAPTTPPSEPEQAPAEERLARGREIGLFL